MAFLIRANHAPAMLMPANGVAFSLPELHHAVGGYIEVVRCRVAFENEPLFLVLNEDGKGLNLPVNPVATVYLRAVHGYESDIAVGDVVLATARELGEGTEDRE